MRAQLLQILADAPKHSNQPPPVVRYNPTTKEAELIAFTASPFQLVDTEHKRILQTKRGLTTEDRSYRYAVVFLITHQSFTNKSKQMRGQAFCAPFAFLHAPRNARAYVTDAKHAGALSTATAHFRLHATSDGNGNRITYGEIDGSKLRNLSAVTTCDHLYSPKKPVEPLAIYRGSHQSPIMLKAFTLTEALTVSNASMERLSQLLDMEEISQHSKDAASTDFHFIWQSLRIYNYYQRNHTPVNTCYNHCVPIWQQCLDKETTSEGLLLKKAIKHFQAIHAQLTEHLHQQKVLPDADLQKLLDKKIEPSICDCSSSFWRRAQGFATAATLAAGVATAAVLTFGGSSEQ